MFEWLSLATVTVSGQVCPIDLSTNHPLTESVDDIFALFNHQLVSNASAGWIKADAMLAGELLDLPVLFEIGATGILQVMVEGHDDLLRAANLRSACRHVFEGDAPRIVVAHTSLWRQADIVAAANELSFGKADCVALDNLFRQSLRRLPFGRDYGGRETFVLRMRGIGSSEGGRAQRA